MYVVILQINVQYGCFINFINYALEYLNNNYLYELLEKSGKTLRIKGDELGFACGLNAHYRRACLGAQTLVYLLIYVYLFIIFLWGYCFMYCLLSPRLSSVAKRTIRCYNSQVNLPILRVKKKYGESRLCVDYWKLNSFTGAHYHG